LNKTDLPSITGLDAKDPRLPKPNIADPLLITATNFLYWCNHKQGQDF
jgi:hypothetical protein